MKKVTLILTAATLGLASLTSAISAQEVHDSVFTKVGFAHTIHSKHLGQDREMFIHLPVNHDTSRSYPLVVLLDGEVSFKAFAATTELMSWQRLIPQCIVVGLVNIDRQQDYSPPIDDAPGSGRADTMLTFFQEELFPYLEQRYNIAGRILWGHSWAGFFVTYAMLEAPWICDAYIVTSPAFRYFDRVFDPGNLFGKLEGLQIKYFMSLGGEELVDEQMERFIEQLEHDAPGSLQSEMMIREGKRQDSNALPGFMSGLEFIFSK